MQALDLSNITLTGELAFRLGRNYSRLEDPMYRASEIFQADKQGWPGDWEGRTILALCLHERISKRKAAFLDEILEALDAQWNERGYLKGICAPEAINEQQLSGHNWLLRGLLELYISRNEEKYAERARRIVENLYLPLLGKFPTYPTAREKRMAKAEAAGQLGEEIVDGWLLSTDIGCAFISMDALAQYYTLFADASVRALLSEMIATFRRIDVEKSSLQTHATLSALRGILRLCEAKPDEDLLTFAKELFAHYVQYGMTANYANYNWFGRPYWTEPCAIVDSYMAAMSLFRLTRQSEYAILANRIYYNALLASQRPNGGFGCDLCSGTEQSGAFVQTNTDVYEAWWCCSMRGAEGLCSAAANSILTEDNQIWFVHYLSGHYCTKNADIVVKTAYPNENRLSVSLCGVKQALQLQLYIPQGAKDVTVRLNGQPQRVQLSDFLRISVCADTVLELSFLLLPENMPAGGFFTTEHAQITMQGDQILGRDEYSRQIFLADRIYTEHDLQCKTEILHLQM